MPTKTDNSFLKDKVSLRLNHLPDKENIKVMDCFAGQGLIWGEIKRKTDKTITIIPIEKKNIKQDSYLKGNNIKFLSIMDLNQYDIIDLDAYGIAYKQLKTIFSRKTLITTPIKIFLTFIQTQYGQLNKGLLADLGYPAKMTRKIPTLFNKNGFDKLKQFLAQNGIRTITYRQFQEKYYIYFQLPLDKQTS